MADVIVVAAALLDDLEEPTAMLAARRARPEHLRGRWEFPGGKVDPGETAEAALHREIREELGVGIRLGAELPGPDDGAWRISERHLMRLWSAVVVDGVPAALEHEELRWLERAAWLDLDWLDADVRIVRALVERVSGDGAARRR